MVVGRCLVSGRWEREMVEVLFDVKVELWESVSVVVGWVVGLILSSALQWPSRQPGRLLLVRWQWVVLPR